MAGRCDRLYHKWHIIENTIARQFWFAGYVSSVYPSFNDNDDTWAVLNALMHTARMLGLGSVFPLTADSISAVIEQQQAKWQELQGHAAQAISSAPETPEHTRADRSPKPSARIVRSESEFSNEQLQQMIDEVWDFAAGIRLEWRPRGRTPEGYECQVLTFDGSEIVLVHPTLLEIPKGPRKSRVRPG